MTFFLGAATGMAVTLGLLLLFFRYLCNRMEEADPRE